MAPAASGLARLCARTATAVAPSVGCSVAGLGRPAQVRCMAVRHVVMFNFKEGVAEDQIASLKADFDAMPSKIPVIQEHESGLDVKLPSGQTHPAGKNRDFFWSCDFADEGAYEAYATHPDHVAVLAKVKELMEPGTRAAIQYKR
mmetsp:Transcript_12856/g.26038  ORF Transcript_12856/g.26038 Transcript_12856/m.26038 type:complete len:145 (+) Transcript_12856:71-505(+)